MRNELGATEQVMNLMFAALDHALDSIREGGDLVPFRMSLSRDGERHLDRFAGAGIDSSRAAMLSSTQSLAADRVAYAIAAEGFITIEGYRYSAILVESADREMPSAIHFMQRYRPWRANLPMAEIGNPAYLGQTANLFQPAA